MRNYLTALGLLAVLLVAIYSNTFSVSWKFDDLPNIVNNASIHLQHLHPDAIAQAFSAHPNGDPGLYRPVACLSFALNWYFGKSQVFGYHIVNLCVHWFTAFFLYLTLVSLLRAPRLADRFAPRHVHSIALLAAVLWAANPVQTQAVNYIVQRMASLAALFSILGIFFYVRARLSRGEYPRGAYFIACGACFVLALGSKENAAVLPLSLVLTEVVFFQPGENPWKNKKILSLGLLAAVTVLVVAYVFFDLNPLFFLRGYAGRPFTLDERLLTEARIVVFYISQLFYPHPDRLSIVHDFPLSRGLLEPWTTAASILLIASMVGFSLLRMRKNPVISFACLFFFLNHIVESTVIPLELVFEHRNYLPSLFLFWPVAIGFHRLVLRFQKQRYLRYAAVAVLPLVILGLGLGTHWRNEVWNTDRGFWEDAARKAPQYKRPYQQLAVYYENQGQLEKAAALLENSRNLKDENPRIGRMVYYNNMGDIKIQQGRYQEAIDYLENLLAYEPHHRIGRGNLVIALMKSQRWAEASEHIDFLLKKRYNIHAYPNLKGLALVQLDRVAEAQRYFRQALEMAPLARETLVNFCSTMSLKGEYHRAHTCLTRAMQFHPEDRSLLIRLAENSIRRGKIREARSYLTRLQAGTASSVPQILAEESRNIFLVPPNEALIFSALEQTPPDAVTVGLQGDLGKPLQMDGSGD